jgi:hypothetical protein
MLESCYRPRESASHEQRSVCRLPEPIRPEDPVTSSVLVIAIIVRAEPDRMMHYELSARKRATIKK